MEIPVTTVLGFLGFICLLIGVILILAGIGIIEIQGFIKITKGRITSMTGIAFMVIGILLIAPEVMRQASIDASSSATATSVPAIGFSSSTSTPEVTNQAINLTATSQVQVITVVMSATSHPTSEPSATATEIPIPVITVAPSGNVDKNCRGRETGATVNGDPAPLSLWQYDCSYNHIFVSGETIILTTWGVLLLKDNATILSASIIPPNITITAPAGESVLFAGYENQIAVEAAYNEGNPGAPTPIP